MDSQFIDYKCSACGLRKRSFDAGCVPRGCCTRQIDKANWDLFVSNIKDKDVQKLASRIKDLPTYVMPMVKVAKGYFKTTTETIVEATYE